ncbi:MAG TPA: AAA family ATPase [Candidatus Bathyarchaeia archaeon]|nr:AAA family ATPase [Candidatus Bathyarchaeia archaeon]
MVKKIVLFLATIIMSVNIHELKASAQAEQAALFNDILTRGFPVRVEFAGADISKGLQAFFKEGGEELGKGFSDMVTQIVKNFNAGKEVGAQVGRNAADAVGEYAVTMRQAMNGQAYDDLRASSFKLGSGTFGAFIESVGASFGKTAIYVALGVALIATGYYMTKFIWGYIERIFKKPRVIIDKGAGFWYRVKRWFFGQKTEEMIFDPRVQEYLDDVVATTRVIHEKVQKKEHNLFYRNILLSGCPGTGKTMFARQLSKMVGMEFVEVTGSSFFQEGAGIAAVDELFDWTRRCKGLVIFIDEADSLLPDRTQLSVGTEEYRIINHFLNYLGQRSNTCMVVMATNHAVVFDEAMERRFDDYIEMPLPQLQTRAQLLAHYRDALILDVHARDTEFADSVLTELSDKKIQILAEKTDGLSHGHLQGIINSIKSDVNATKEGVVTEKLVDKAVDRYINKHQALKKQTIVDGHGQKIMHLSAVPVM